MSLEFELTDDGQRTTLLQEDHNTLDDLPWLHREYVRVIEILGTGHDLSFSDFCYAVCFQKVS
jgi:hypothetical protein